MEKTNTFSLYTLGNLFTESYDDNSKYIKLDPYIKGFEELEKYLNTLGTVFTFVTRDIHEKLLILRRWRQSPQQDNYFTIDQMLDYETKIGRANTGNKCPDPSGSRTLLRLHRALDFISLFIERVYKMKSDGSDSIHEIANGSYKETLGQYHSWVIRKTISLALYGLPNRDYLINSLLPYDQYELESVRDEITTKTFTVIRRVYDHTEKLYKKYDLLDLP
ncbi:hypothetical protein SNEBB_004502 [Seison nebaliae]|nr:hypothetical protein SNEBB_004502 [Seison nebaliae]